MNLTNKHETLDKANIIRVNSTGTKWWFKYVDMKHGAWAMTKLGKRLEGPGYIKGNHV